MESLIAQNTFQINAGKSFNINTSGIFGTLTLVVLGPSNNVVNNGSMFCLSPSATPTPAAILSTLSPGDTSKSLFERRD